MMLSSSKSQELMLPQGWSAVHSIKSGQGLDDKYLKRGAIRQLEIKECLRDGLSGIAVDLPARSAKDAFDGI